MHKNDQSTVSEAVVTVCEDSFAVGKQIRDIFWPHNLFILSIKFVSNNHIEVDEHGGKSIRAGDVLHVRYSTYNEERTIEELLAIVGHQEIEKIKVEKYYGKQNDYRSSLHGRGKKACER